jgi:mono/diheme cytochrome c family protein
VQEWSPAEIVQMLRTGIAPRGGVLGPMAEVVLASTQYLRPDDLQSMAVFLKALPTAHGETDTRAPLQGTAALVERGRKLYGTHCAQCHGEQGEGVGQAYPRLAGNRAVKLPVTANLVQVVLYGGFAPATEGNPRPFGMPPFAMLMSDADVAAVLTYIRGSWNNQAAAVSEFDVSQQRSSH